MAKCLLFAYGMLQPTQRPPATLSASWPDALRGELYDLGDYPGARRIGVADDLIPGWVVEIDDEELPTLDAFEDVDAGLYARIRATTEGGRVVWVYEHIADLPATARRIRRWPA